MLRACLPTGESGRITRLWGWVACKAQRPNGEWQVAGGTWKCQVGHAGATSRVGHSGAFMRVFRAMSCVKITLGKFCLSGNQPLSIEGNAKSIQALFPDLK
jgi:hypothetical protein